MKTKLILILLAIVLAPALIPAQSETLNAYDNNGKKHGKWMVYLDVNWAQINDKVTATYARYNYYDHGVSLYPMGPSGKKGYKLVMVDNQPPGSKVLDGTYKWLDKKGNTTSVHIFQNGVYISCKEYFATGQLNQHFDYTKKYKKQQHSWQLTIYDKAGKAVYNFNFHQNEDGTWPKTKG